MTLTLNNILKLFRLWTEKHVFFQDFRFGTQTMLNDAVRNNTDLPLMYVTLKNVKLHDNTVDYYLSIKSLDSRSREETDNYPDILSDQIQNLTDFRKFLIYSESQSFWSNAEDSATMSPLTNVTADYLSGMEMDIICSTRLNQTDCDVPTIEAALEAMVLEFYNYHVYQDGVYIPAGEDYIIELEED